MTNTHITDELPRLLTGEADRETVLAAAEHLRSCVDCQHELISALVAHASLSSARRYAPEIATGTFAGFAGDTHTGDTQAGETDEPADAEAAADVAPEATAPARSAAPHPLPDLSAVFAQVRAEADGERQAPRRRTRLLVVAAAAVVVLGGAGAIYAVSSGDGGGSQVAEGRVVTLDAFGKGTTSATARVNSHGMTLDASSLPQVAGTRYEVWLTNSQRTRMQPIGWVGANGKAQLSVPADLMSQFQDIEVSVQNVHAGSYDYSGTSVLRGSIT